MHNQSEQLLSCVSRKGSTRTVLIILRNDFGRCRSIKTVRPSLLYPAMQGTSYSRLTIFTRRRNAFTTSSRTGVINVFRFVPDFLLQFHGDLNFAAYTGKPIPKKPGSLTRGPIPSRGNRRLCQRPNDYRGRPS